MDHEAPCKVLATLRFEFAPIGIRRCTGFFNFGLAWNYPNVPRTFNRLYLIHSGYGEVTWDDRVVPLRPGYAYLFPCNSRISLHCPQRMAQWRTHFNLWTLGGVDIFDLLHLDSPEIRPAPAYQRRFMNLVADYPPADLMQANRCFRHLTYLIEPFLERINTHPLLARIGQMMVFERALKVIESSLAHTLTVADLAKTMNWTPDHFAHMFRQAFGCLPYRFITQQRIRRAKELLLATPMSIKEIAFALGYDDQYYFSRLFKKQESLSPLQFRRRFSVVNE